MPSTFCQKQCLEVNRRGSYDDQTPDDAHFTRDLIMQSTGNNRAFPAIAALRKLKKRVPIEKGNDFSIPATVSMQPNHLTFCLIGVSGN